MREVPVRGADGTIAALVDPRALEEADTSPAPEADTPDTTQEPTTRRSRALRPDERKPLGELLRSSAQPQQHANRSFTTGMAAGLIGALIVVGLVLASRAPASAPAELPTSARATASVLTSATSAPVGAVAPPTLGRALVAYAAPEGGVVGAISSDRAITLTGTFGSDWVQLQTADSGQVWVKKVELPSSMLDPAVLARLPDLAPPPTATAVLMPTVAPVARPDAPARAPMIDRAPAQAPASGCTPDHVVAIVERGATQIASCVSLADAQSSLPGATVIASSNEEAQAFYARVVRDATAFAQPTP